MLELYTVVPQLMAAIRAEDRVHLAAFLTGVAGRPHKILTAIRGMVRAIRTLGPVRGSQDQHLKCQGRGRQADGFR